MELRDFLARLVVKKGPSATGEYMCRCPAHDDKKASLSVRMGDKGIVCKCQAGCSTEDVLGAMGLKMRDLFVGDDESSVPGHTVHTASKSKAASKPKADAEPAQAPAKIDAIYPYTDESGAVLFEVVRYYPKDFRQRVPDKAAKGGYRWSIKGVRSVVYRLPEVLGAIERGETVYLVEGEKDVETLRSLGLVATTCPMGAGKWTEAHNQLLAGADVCVVPDNDKPGRDHAQKAAAMLLDVAKRVRLLDLTLICALPDKGDVSDMVLLKGRDLAADALKRLAEQTADYERDLREVATAIYESVPGYCVSMDGCLSKLLADGQLKKLCTFLALPTAIVTRDDGVNLEKVFLIDGWTCKGKRLPQISVSAKNFASMSWVLENWDFAANILPGNTVKDCLRYAISEAGEMHAKRETVYAHMGWRRIGEQWAYLHPGGAIGAEDVRVELDSALTGYTLDAAEGISALDAAESPLFFRAAMAEHVSVPLLGLIFLTPLREFLARAGYSPRFAMFLLGGTGTHKSTASQLALSFYGRFSIDTLPASFHDTANSVRKKAFILKDALLAVDDYHPEMSLQERRRMEAMAQSLARAFGDGADRGRMRADLTLQEAMPPRGMALMSGEDMPSIGESGMARFYTIAISREDIPVTDGLEIAQDMARRGYMRMCMRGYIEWLANRADNLVDKLPEIYIKLRKRALDEGGSMHGRSAEAVAHIMLGYEMMLNYMADAGAISSEQADKDFLDAWREIMENSQKQGQEAREERPSKMYVDAVRELLTSKQATVKDLAVQDSPEPGPSMIGYSDGAYYYLMPDLAYTRVSKLYSDQGMAFPLTKRMLYKQLRDDGLIVSSYDGKATRLKYTGTKTLRLLWIKRSTIDGEDYTPPPEQTTMEGATIVDADEDMPF